MYPALLHPSEQMVDIHALRHLQYVAPQRLHAESGIEGRTEARRRAIAGAALDVARQEEQHIFYVQDALDVVEIPLVDGVTAVPILLDGPHHLEQSGIDRDGVDLSAWQHNLPGCEVAQVKHPV